MNWLTGCASDCTNGKRFRYLFLIAVVAFCPALLDYLDLTVKAHCTALDQRDVGCEAHLVDMAAGVEIVQGIEDEVEGLEPFNVELGVFDVGVAGGEGDGGVEFGSGFFGDLGGWRAKVSECAVGLGNVAWAAGRRTIAFGFLICSCLKRNWRLRLLRSIVSRSIMWISPKPVRARFLSNSQPMPPAPTSRTRDWSQLANATEGRALNWRTCLMSV
jgi:hypothetical protein